jgi:hypothetical protein
MKIEASDLGRGVALACETIVSQTILTQRAIDQTTKGDGLNLRPND